MEPRRARVPTTQAKLWLVLTLIVLPAAVHPVWAASAIEVASDGNVGIGTASPRAPLHVLEGGTPFVPDPDTVAVIQQSAAGEGVVLSLIGDANSQLGFGDSANEFAGRLVYDHGSDALRIFTNSSERMRIAADGKLGVGTSSPQAALHVLEGGTPFVPDPDTVAVIQQAAAGEGAVLSLIGDANSQLAFGDSANEFAGRFVYDHTVDALRTFTGGLERMRITSDGRIGIGVTSVAAGNVIQHSNGATLTSGGTWADASSRELKENIHPLSRHEALEAVLELKPVKYNYKATPSEPYVGFIAEEVPELVALGERKNLAPMEIIAVLTRVVQNQQGVIVHLENAINGMEEKLTTRNQHLDELRNELDQLKAMVGSLAER